MQHTGLRLLTSMLSVTKEEEKGGEIEEYDEEKAG